MEEIRKNIQTKKIDIANAVINHGLDLEWTLKNVMRFSDQDIFDYKRQRKIKQREEKLKRILNDL